MAELKALVYKLTIEEHPNADALELAVIGGYRAVVVKGQFKTGDVAVYLPEQSVVPDWLIVKMGLEGRLAGKAKNRVKAQKLRGILSQGLVYPLDSGIDPSGETHLTLSYMKDGTLVYEFNIKEGDDVTELLGITKWEPEIPTSMNGKVWNAMGRTIHYDIENWKRYPDILQDGEEVVFTEKLHGCVSSDTLVMLPNGEERPIIDIINGDNINHVLSYDVESDTFYSKKITAKFKRSNTENKRWMCLTLENGRKLKITEDHPLWSNDRNQYVKAKELLPNEDIKSPN